MTAAAITPTLRDLPPWALGFAAFGLLWSLFGAYQFYTSVFSSAEHLMAMGLTPEQAALYAASPLWIDLAFAVGVFGGIFGSALLLAGRRRALDVLAASLAGYVVLYLGDIATGVFAAFGPPQVVVLSFVVLVAAGLFLTARRLARAGRLA